MDSLLGLTAALLDGTLDDGRKLDTGSDIVDVDGKVLGNMIAADVTTDPVMGDVPTSSEDLPVCPNAHFRAGPMLMLVELGKE